MFPFRAMLSCAILTSALLTLTFLLFCLLHITELSFPLPLFMFAEYTSVLGLNRISVSENIIRMRRENEWKIVKSIRDSNPDLSLLIWGFSFIIHLRVFVYLRSVHISDSMFFPLNWRTTVRIHLLWAENIYGQMPFSFHPNFGFDVASRKSVTVVFLLEQFHFLEAPSHFLGHVIFFQPIKKRARERRETCMGLGERVSCSFFKLDSISLTVIVLTQCNKYE